MISQKKEICVENVVNLSNAFELLLKIKNPCFNGGNVI